MAGLSSLFLLGSRVKTGFTWSLLSSSPSRAQLQVDCQDIALVTLAFPEDMLFSCLCFCGLIALWLTAPWNASSIWYPFWIYNRSLKQRTFARVQEVLLRMFWPLILQAFLLVLVSRDWFLSICGVTCGQLLKQACRNSAEILASSSFTSCPPGSCLSDMIHFVN